MDKLEQRLRDDRHARGACWCGVPLGDAVKGKGHHTACGPDSIKEAK